MSPRSPQRLGPSGTIFVAAIIVAGILVVPAGFLIAPISASSIGELVYLGLLTQIASMMPITWRQGAQTLDTMPLVAAALLLPGSGVLLIAWFCKFSRREFTSDFPAWRGAFNRSKTALEFGLPSVLVAHIHLAGPIETPVRTLILSALSIAIGYPIVARFFAYLEHDRVISVLRSNVGLYTLQSNLVLGFGGGALSMLLRLPAGYVMGLGLLGLLWTVRSNMLGIQRQRDQHIQTLEVLAQALDARDPMTERHSQRVAELAARIGSLMKLPSATVDALRTAGLLHDIGKIGVRDSILSKGGPLSAEEWRVMKLHAGIGADMVASHSTLESIAPWVRHHHERWDGSGYPDGLVGAACPLGARILAVADSFDTATGPRIYRGSVMTPEQAVEDITNSVALYDREVVDALRALYGLPRLSDRNGRDAAGARSYFEGLHLLRSSSAFRLFTAGNCISSLGDPLTTLAIVLTVYSISRNPVLVAMVYAVKALSTAMAANLLGGISDRLDRRRVIIVSDLVRSATLLSLPFAIGHSIWWLFPAVVALSAAQSVGQTSRDAAIPALLPNHQVIAGNAAIGAFSMAAGAIGYPLAVALFAAGHGTTLLFTVDGLTFVAAAALTGRLPGLLGGGRRSSPIGGATRNTFSLPVVRLPLLFSGVAALFISMAQPTIVVLAADIGGTGARAYGFLETAITVGLIAGNVALMIVKFRPGFSVPFVGLLVMGVLSIGVASSKSLSLSAALLLGASIGNALYTVGIRSLLQHIAPSSMRGTVMSTRFMIVQLASVGGSSLGGLVALKLGPTVVFAALGLSLIAIVAVASTLPGVRSTFNEIRVPVTTV